MLPIENVNFQYRKRRKKDPILAGTNKQQLFTADSNEPIRFFEVYFSKKTEQEHFKNTE